MGKGSNSKNNIMLPFISGVTSEITIISIDTTDAIRTH